MFPQCFVFEKIFLIKSVRLKILVVVSTISAKIQIKCLLINYGKMSKQRAKKYNKHKSGKKIWKNMSRLTGMYTSP